ncbi:MAG: tryptophan--tRNA ligase [Chloroflexi bacterium]|nr:MAG: tryptophan--tRNA ligase [Chloroflexota bacterium]
MSLQATIRVVPREPLAPWAQGFLIWEKRLKDRNRRKRILTGDRPTSDAFHLGNYVGTLANRVRLQDEYDTFLLLADLHLLTTRTSDLEEVGHNIHELVLDYLSVGIDHEKTTIYLQSLVPEVLELAWIFMSLVSVPRAQRIPTLKEVVRDLKLDTASMALLSYPVLQAADILMVKGNLVPVGKDQLSHIELTREIARRFNDTFAPVFPAPEGLVGNVPTLPGTDGKAKMGKSLGNAIFLRDDAETVKRKVMSMYTDPKRIRADIPGRVQGNPVFIYHDAFNDDKAEVEDLKARYHKGKVGDVEVKQKLIAGLNRFLEPIRERRARFAAEKGLVEEILSRGTARARQECLQTLSEARDAMGLTYFRDREAIQVLK